MIPRGTSVLVRAIDDEPLTLIAVAAGKVVVDVVSDDPSMRASFGVPLRRVFAQDDTLFEGLCTLFDEGRHEALGVLWTQATAADLTRLPPRVLPITPPRHP